MKSITQCGIANQLLRIRFQRRPGPRDATSLIDDRLVLWQLLANQNRVNDALTPRLNGNGAVDIPVLVKIEC